MFRRLLRAPLSLRARMGLAAGVAVALAVIAVAVSAYAGTRSVLRSQVDRSLQSLTQQVLGPSAAPGHGGAGYGGSGYGGSGYAGAAQGVTGQGATGSGTPAAGSLGQGGFPPVGRPGSDGLDGTSRDEGLGLDNRGGPAFGGAPGALTLVRKSGTTFVPSGQSAALPVDSRARALAAHGSGSHYTDVTVRGTQLRMLATGIGWRGALLVALPLKDVNSALSSQLLLLVVIAAAGIALAALLGFLVARTALAPIARFTRQTEVIAAHPGRLADERLDVDGGDELARLAQTFNLTLDALDASVQAQRNLIADASHELRTPIATIRANLQVMRDEQLLSPEDREALRADVIEELDELTALVSDVVELARGTKPNAQAGDVRVDEIVAAAVERTRRRAPTITIQTDLEPTLVHGEGDRIARAVANLLDNAVKWSLATGVIEAELHNGVLTVRDHGPGFAQEDLGLVFDRFHRAADARSKPGSGLGLAIVRQAAEAHGGFVSAHNAPGGGALMQISFGPASRPAEARAAPVAPVRG